jgi:hypothetical protein
LFLQLIDGGQLPGYGESNDICKIILKMILEDAERNRGLFDDVIRPQGIKSC